MSKRILYVHYHIPKTAGTSLNKCLLEWFGPGYLPLYHDVPGYSYSKSDLDSAIYDNPEADCISSHSIGKYYPQIAGRPTAYFCFVRHPILYTRSNYSYCKKNFDSLTREHKASFSDDLSKYTSEELTQRLIRNEQTSVFLSHFLSSELKTYRSLNPEPKTTKDSFDEILLAMAIQKIDSFSFVGLQEMFDQHLYFLSDIIQAGGYSAPIPEIPKCNVSDGGPMNTNWMHELDSNGKSLCDYEWAGIAFYNYCRSKWGFAPQ